MAEHRYPQGSVFYRKLRKSYPRIVRGEGCRLYDEDGKRYLDACGGAFVANLGHGVAEVADELSRQARRFGYVNGTAFTHEPVERLAAEIASLNPKGLDKIYFLSSGSEAVEAALKLARQYWAEAGKPEKHKIIALSPAYHGNTLLALSASAREQYKTYYRGWLVDVARVKAPYAYRCPCRGEGPQCPACSGTALEEAILREGPQNVAAFIAEPVGGSSTGACVPRPGYFRRVREICDRHQVLFIADEVLTGAGRTGTWSAIEQFGAVPDIMTLGKGIGGGYAPLSAVCVCEPILDVIARGSGAFLHAQTFSHNPVLCAAGLAAVTYIKSHGLIERCAQMGKILHERLRPLLELPHVGDIRGRGLLAGVEFVEDKATRAPFPRKLKFAESFTEAAQAAGLVVWPSTGHAASGSEPSLAASGNALPPGAGGEEGDLVMLAPPFIVSERDIDEIVSLFKAAYEAATRSLKASA